MLHLFLGGIRGGSLSQSGSFPGASASCKHTRRKACIGAEFLGNLVDEILKPFLAQRMSHFSFGLLP